MGDELRWAKSRDSYRRITSESYRCDSNRQLSLVVIYLPQNTEMSPDRPCVRCAAIRIARLRRLAFIRVVFVPRGIAEWPARVDRVRCLLAIGDWRFCPSKVMSLLPHDGANPPRDNSGIAAKGVSECQLTHLIGAQPVLESHGVF